ncbi:MAG: tRNA 2-thiouridine(34) synthase MnmA, partial [Paracoccaceae bacterium]|nr:tRNA 2-thiouridine(34) synthase MnmA [Paracoccaceae bacterium]
SAEAGEIVHADGRKLGHHEGVINYTIGQRRGLGIGGLSDPLYVVRLDVDAKQVIVGPKEMLSTRLIPVREINWLGDEPFDSKDERQIAVKVRSTRPPREAIIRPLTATTAEVELLSPEEGVSPGQACVFYDTDSSRIFGGGWIWRG